MNRRFGTMVGGGLLAYEALTGCSNPPATSADVEGALRDVTVAEGNIMSLTVPGSCEFSVLRTLISVDTESFPDTDGPDNLAHIFDLGCEGSEATHSHTQLADAAYEVFLNEVTPARFRYAEVENRRNPESNTKAWVMVGLVVLGFGGIVVKLHRISKDYEPDDMEAHF